MLASLFVDGFLAPASSRQIGAPVFDDRARIGPVLDLAATPTQSAPGRSDTVGLALVDTGLVSDVTRDPCRQYGRRLCGPAHGGGSTRR